MFDTVKVVIYTPEYISIYIFVDCGVRTHEPKTQGLSTTPFVKGLEGICPFDQLQKV